mmetsp:Transcript_85332/g.228189  ORF Transcript_85332/g.228189 Transcript_85332/m.228189 type:complete len:238 (+) Transcript_85332:1068-1781(+)
MVVVGHAGELRDGHAALMDIRAEKRTLVLQQGLIVPPPGGVREQLRPRVHQQAVEHHHQGAQPARPGFLLGGERIGEGVVAALSPTFRHTVLKNSPPLGGVEPNHIGGQRHHVPGVWLSARHSQWGSAATRRGRHRGRLHQRPVGGRSRRDRLGDPRDSVRRSLLRTQAQKSSGVHWINLDLAFGAQPPAVGLLRLTPQRTPRMAEGQILDVSKTALSRQGEIARADTTSSCSRLRT